MKRFTLFLALLLVLAVSASARLNVVSLPGRDTVQLTIYNSVDLTLVKETRHLTFRKGLNKLEFSWANTLIDPTSVEFRPLTSADKIEVVDVSFPPRVANTLEWRIQSEVAGDVVVEIRYFTSGLKWSADYVVEASGDEKTAKLSGNVRVTNNSGEDYENAQIRLLVGTIKLVDEIAILAQQGRPGQPTAIPMSAPAPMLEARRSLSRAMAAGVALAEDRMEKAKEIVKEELSEYFLFTIEGRDTVPNGWSKRLPSFQAEGVPIESLYKFEKERFGVSVVRHYKFKNDTMSKLGQVPLPDGEVKAFRQADKDGLLHFVGATRVKYIPVNEDIELVLGPDPEVLVRPVMTNWEKTDLRFNNDGRVIGSTFKETWEFTVQNSRAIDVTVDIRRNFSGDWSIETTAANDKMDNAKVKFLRTLKPREKQTFTYELTRRTGANATR